MKTNAKRILIPILGLILVGCIFADAASSEGEAFFESKIRPLLVEHCYECHSGEKTKASLSLDTRSGWQTGGESGAAIIPGKPSESLLVEAVRYENQDLQMPPEKHGGKLSEDQISSLATWIEMGAPDPREAETKIAGMSAETAKTWWAFQQLPVPVPGKIDDFFAEKQPFDPNPRADKRSLIRRATYDLTGLPPTPEEVDEFIADASPDAFAKVVDRLLTSPQYGVRWGRHWLDVVRYADTAGENTDRPLPHAWRYRNWVFDAFNRDLRYDDFVRMQLAGDLLAKDNAEGIIATGYLALARRFGHDIADEKNVLLMHEDVIDNLGKNFLGLTTGCARCHDHKYDPITAQDYYALYGIFDSSRFSFPGCEKTGQPRDLVPLISADEIEAVLSPWRERKTIAEAEQKRFDEFLAKANEATDQSAKLLAESSVSEGQSVPFNVPSIAVRQGEVLQLIVGPNANHGADSTLVEWTIRENGGEGRSWSVANLIGDITRSNPIAGAHEATWCFLEVTKGPVFLGDKHDEIEKRSDLKGWSLGDVPSVFANSNAEPTKVWTELPATSFFVHPGPNRPVATAWICPIDGSVKITGRVADAHPSGGDGVNFKLEHFEETELGPALIALGKGHVESEEPPPIPSAYAVVDAEPQNVRLHQRGDPEQPGDEVQRRWLTVFGGEPVGADSGSGRKQLGDWIAENPLAARVMVNRVWHWHFGEGLVRSPNDFGSRGELPTHPELLDWLAAQFVAADFRVKPLHRLIMNTEPYQRSSARPDEFTTADPENRWLGRFERRRLSAEEIRDSLLAVSGKLDIAAAEAHPFPTEKSWNFTQHNPFNAVYDSNKRSAFLMVQRQRRHPFLALFDGADPNASTPSRETTATPSQALYFLNAPFFHEQASAFAALVEKESPEDDSRIARTYRVLFQRSPTTAETERGLRFLSVYPAASTEKWAAYARVLLASNEFTHLD
ncbi:MAG: hypothetical protein ACI8UO_005341 [Verrucomicrobiales bacterium]|jgi:hypothetical protein